MAAEFSDFRSDVSFFLSSLRNAIDRPLRESPTVEESERGRYRRTMLLVEEARIHLNSYTRFRGDEANGDWSQIREQLLSFVEVFSREVDREMLSRRFRPIMSISPNRDRARNSPFISDFLNVKTISVGGALDAFHKYLLQLNIESLPSQQKLPLEDLERIVPGQQVAPVQFDVIQGKIVVADRKAKKNADDEANISAALEHIRERGEQLVESLENSNCDRRLLESVKELQSQLVTDKNVIKIGLSNLACGMMCAQFKSELPNAISAMVTSYNASVSLYVAQFPEWEQFTSKAALIELNEEDIRQIDLAAESLILELTSNPNLADPEVPKTIKFVRQFLTFPGASIKRAAFAMLSTIENLVSSILLHTVAFVSKTTEKTVERASTEASKVIIGLLGIALAGALGISIPAAHTGASWVKEAAEIVQRQIEKSME